MPREPKHSVVTGGAGFIGSHLCEALLERGDRVTCVDDLSGCGRSLRNVLHLADHPGFDIVEEDVLDWARRADLSGVDRVFHEAVSKKTVSLADPERDLLVNTLGTLRLLLLARDQHVRKFVLASTGSVFGRAEERQVEETPRNPASLYGVSKTAAESYCQVIGSDGLDYSVLRYYHVVGPRQDSSERGGVVPIFVRRCLEGRPMIIYGDGAQTRSFTSVHDVVRANLLVADAPAASRQAFNCASGIAVSIRELADFVADELGNRRPIEYAPPQPGDIARFDVDSSKLRALGLEFATDWRAMVREVIAAESG